MFPIGLIRLVAAAFRGQLVIQELGADPQPLSPRARDRLGRIPPLLLELTVRLPQPSPPPVRADPLRIEAIRRLTAGLLRPALASFGLGSLARQLPLKPLPPARLGLKLRWQLVTRASPSCSSSASSVAIASARISLAIRS